MPEHQWCRRLPHRLVSSGADWLWPDIVAGLTTGAVIIPMAMAYAMIAGLPVQVGLYTALVPMVIYAVLGTSRVLSVSTTTTLAILTAAQLGQAVPNGNPAALLRASATLTLLVGAALLLALPAAPGNRGELYLRAGTRRIQSRHRAGHCGGPDPEDPWHPLHARTFVQNVLSTVHTLPKTSLATLAVGLMIILFLLDYEAVPAETASAVAGCSCCDSGRVLLAICSIAVSNWWATYRQDCPRW